MVTITKKKMTPIRWLVWLVCTSICSMIPSALAQEAARREIDQAVLESIAYLEYDTKKEVLTYRSSYTKWLKGKYSTPSSIAELYKNIAWVVNPKSTASQVNYALMPSYMTSFLRGIGMGYARDGKHSMLITDKYMVSWGTKKKKRVLKSLATALFLQAALDIYFELDVATMNKHRSKHHQVSGFNRFMANGFMRTLIPNASSLSRTKGVKDVLKLHVKHLTKVNKELNNIVGKNFKNRILVKGSTRGGDVSNEQLEELYNAIDLSWEKEIKNMEKKKGWFTWKSISMILLVIVALSSFSYYYRVAAKKKAALASKDDDEDDDDDDE